MVKVVPGVLRVVGTPLGNLGDMSERGREVLASADMIACEDTRRTGQLLKLLAVKAPKLVSFHKDNERVQVRGVPGHHVVQQAHAAGVRNQVLPSRFRQHGVSPPGAGDPPGPSAPTA